MLLSLLRTLYLALAPDPIAAACLLSAGPRAAAIT